MLILPVKMAQRAAGGALACGEGLVRLKPLPQVFDRVETPPEKRGLTIGADGPFVLAEGHPCGYD